MRKIFFVILFALCCISSLLAQEIEIGDPETLSFRTRQWDVYGTIHTNGFGIGCQFGKEHNIRLRSGFDVEYTYYRHFKERRRNDQFVLVYGKLNYFGMLRGGYGFTHIFTSKPYWGGVETAYFLYGGVSLGLSVPVYLYIVPHDKEDPQRYDPEVHKLGNIIGTASFWKGFKEIKPHPGLYIKTGLSFDFARNDADILKLDIGAASDFYLIPVEKMASSPKQYVLFTGYLTFHFGKRLTNYE
ncbi:MAG: hypothetical protein FWH36_09155 [Lentimicrobiaceae bacterium]|nr:hypothetical protein [Lentimicrobiaceae bacterium]